MAVAGGPSVTLKLRPVRQALNFRYPDWEVQWPPDGRRPVVDAEAQGPDQGTSILAAEGGDHASIVVADASGPISARDDRV